MVNIAAFPYPVGHDGMGAVEEGGIARMRVQLRGSMGGGKSTTIRRLLQEHAGVEVERHVWRCDGDLYIPGSYRLDGPSPGTGGNRLADDTVRLLAERHEHLLWEGMAASTIRPKEWQRELGVIQAFIVLTPDQTIANIYRRRVERNRNVGQPLTERSIRANLSSIIRMSNALLAEGWPVVRLAFREDLYEQLHDLLTWGGWPCDSHPRTFKYDWERRVRLRVA